MNLQMAGWIATTENTKHDFVASGEKTNVFQMFFFLFFYCIIRLWEKSNVV